MGLGAIGVGKWVVSKSKSNHSLKGIYQSRMWKTYLKQSKMISPVRKRLDALIRTGQSRLIILVKGKRKKKNLSL